MIILFFAMKLEAGMSKKSTSIFFAFVHDNEKNNRHLSTKFSPRGSYTELSSGLGRICVCFLFSKILFSSSVKEYPFGDVLAESLC